MKTEKHYAAMTCMRLLLLLLTLLNDADGHGKEGKLATRARNNCATLDHLYDSHR